MFYATHFNDAACGAHRSFVHGVLRRVDNRHVDRFARFLAPTSCDAALDLTTSSFNVLLTNREPDPHFTRTTSAHTAVSPCWMMHRMSTHDPASSGGGCHSLAPVRLPPPSPSSLPHVHATRTTLDLIAFSPPNSSSHPMGKPDPRCLCLHHLRPGSIDALVLPR